MQEHKTKSYSLKALGSGNPIEALTLEKINNHTLVKLTAEQVYVRTFIMAHNGIDRDKERFSELLFDDYARTLIGKGFFLGGHPAAFGGKGQAGDGIFYDARTQEMTPAEFLTLTGEGINLPSGIIKAKVLFGDVYILKLDSNSEVLSKIDAGICKFVSIGFRAQYTEVKDTGGTLLYGEYRPTGEATEGSLVWLGAQQGAIAKELGNNNKGGIIMLKELESILGKTFTDESQAAEGVKEVIEGYKAKIALLEPLAEDGKAYKSSLVEDVLRYSVMIEDIGTDEASQNREKEFLQELSVSRLKVMLDRCFTRAKALYPEKASFVSKDVSDRTNKKQGHTDNKGRKDYTDKENNELLSLVEA